MGMTLGEFLDWAGTGTWRAGGQVTITQSEREAWLERRRSGIGASDVAGIVGLSPWASPWSVWVSKVMPVDDDGASEAMEHGQRAEPMLKQWFEDRTEFWVLGEQQEAQHPEHPWALATLDGSVFEAHGGCDDLELRLGIAEWKVTSDPPWDHGVPLYYQCQAQWSMFVTGAERTFFGVLHIAFGRPTFRVYEFQRDQADIDYLYDACRRFWFDHVTTGIPPQTDGTEATTDALATAYPDGSDAVIADLEHLSAIALVRQWRQAVKDAETQLEAARNALKALIGESESIIELDVKGKPKTLASWKAESRTTIDPEALRTALPDVAAQFSKTTSTRVLRVN